MRKNKEHDEVKCEFARTYLRIVQLRERHDRVRTLLPFPFFAAFLLRLRGNVGLESNVVDLGRMRRHLGQSAQLEIDQRGKGVKGKGTYRTQAQRSCAGLSQKPCQEPHECNSAEWDEILSMIRLVEVEFKSTGQVSCMPST